MKTSAKRISLLLWLAVAAVHLSLSALPASATSAVSLDSADRKFAPLAESLRINSAKHAKLQRESVRNPPLGVLVVAKNDLNNLVRSLAEIRPGPEKTASVPDNVFAYNPGPKGFVIQEDGPLITGNQAAVAQGDLSGAIPDPARMLPASIDVTNQLPGLVIGQFDMVTDLGPLASLPSNPAANFASGKYNSNNFDRRRCVISRRIFCRESFGSMVHGGTAVFCS